MICNDVVQPILEEVVQGYNCTLFAYGPTRTGKTYVHVARRLDAFSYRWSLCRRRYGPKDAQQVVQILGDECSGLLYSIQISYHNEAQGPHGPWDFWACWIVSPHERRRNCGWSWTSQNPRRSRSWEGVLI